MSEEHLISRQVAAAREDPRAADRLIESSMPFIRAETAKFLKRPPLEGQDDELSIAMIAFHEAIGSYSRLRGAFFAYAATLIRHRLIDYARKEKRHRGVLSLEAPADEERTVGELLESPENPPEEMALRDATRAEIDELSAQMRLFGVELSDVAENSPRQRRTLLACRKALEYVVGNQRLMEDFLHSRRLPISDLSAGSGVERKTLERHRKYMVALLLIHTNGYEIIRGHIKQVLKGGGEA